MAVLEVSDIHVYDPDIDDALAQAMIDDALAQAKLAAPCLNNEDDLTPDQVAQFRSVLRAVVLRWNDQGADR